jgi:hypothetical protein
MCQRFALNVLKPSVSNVRPLGEFVIAQAVCGRNGCNDGRNAAGKASVGRPCRHTAHARTHRVRKNRHHRPPGVRALRPALLFSPEAIHLRAGARNTLKIMERFFTHSYDFLFTLVHKRECG